MKIRQKIGQFIQKKINVSSGARLILGVSGGVDSVVMLHVLSSLDYKCVVAHCNFHLRSEESNRDEAFVKALAESFRLPFLKTDFDTREYARQQKISIEMAARDLRYAWFEKIRKEQNAEAIAVAHHADDSVETFLMNLMRGSGLRGLKGIEPINGNVIRPLLCCTRGEIETYARVNKLKSVFDSTNSNTDFLRNKIRLELLPMLAEFNPSIRQTLTETIGRMQGAWKVFENNIEKITRENTFRQNGYLYIDIQKLQRQPDVNTVLFELLQPYHFHTDVVNQIVENLQDTSGARFQSDGYVLIKDREYLILSEEKRRNDFETEISEGNIEIKTPIHLFFNKKEKKDDFNISKTKEAVHVDFDKLRFPLTLRVWRAGDIFYPFGMTRSKKVSDFLIDEKVNVLEKQHTYVLLSGNDIVWVVGMRVDNRFRVTNETKNVFEIIILKN